MVIENILCYKLTKDAFNKKESEVGLLFHSKKMPLYLLNSDTGVILFLQCFIDFVEYKLIWIIAIITKDVYAAFFEIFKDCCGEYWMKTKNIFFT